MSSSPPPLAPRILISGAGIAGLSAARSILLFSSERSLVPPSLTIVERERPSSRLSNEHQGPSYTISIRADRLGGGVQALHRMHLLDQIRKQITLNYTTFSFCGQDVTSPLLQINHLDTSTSIEHQSIRVQRNYLRQTLLDGVNHYNDKIIQWNKTITSCKINNKSDNHRVVEVEFSDNSRGEYDLLIVADGSRSHLRSLLLPSESLRFAGICAYSGTSVLSSIPPPLSTGPIAAMSGNGIGIFMAINNINQNEVTWAISQKSNTPINPQKGCHMNQNHFIEFKKNVNELVRTSGFSEPVPTLVEQCLNKETVMIFNAMDKMPHMSHSPVVYIGDANHPMSPYAGNGANMALMDGVELGDLLTSESSLDKAISKFNKATRGRSTKAIDMSRCTIDLLHSSGIKYQLYKSLLTGVSFLSRHRKAVKFGALTLTLLSAAAFVFMFNAPKTSTPSFSRSTKSS